MSGRKEVMSATSALRWRGEPIPEMEHLALNEEINASQWASMRWHGELLRKPILRRYSNT
jgi:hypothetical protein